MTERDRSAWLWVKVGLFTLLVPGTVTVLVPYLLLDGAAAVDWLGIPAVGVVPMALGAALYFRCAFDFAWSGRGTPAPVDPPAALVIGGPYRYCRNPMYAGVLAVIGGEALLFQEPRLGYYLLLMAILFHGFILGYEERVLRRRFGPSYADYYRTIPRWVPRAAGWAALYRKSFARVGALVLGAGAVAHVLRLSVGLPVAEMPASVHALLVALPAYGGIGCITYARRFVLPGLWHQAVFALATGLLIATAALHAWSIVVDDSGWLGLFPIWYSVGAALVYAGLALFLKTRRLAS